MFLIRKGRKPVPVCRECAKAHAAKDCPAKSNRSPRRFVQRALAYQRLLMERATG